MQKIMKLWMMNVLLVTGVCASQQEEHVQEARFPSIPKVIWHDQIAAAMMRKMFSERDLWCLINPGKPNQETIKTFQMHPYTLVSNVYCERSYMMTPLHFLAAKKPSELLTLLSDEKIGTIVAPFLGKGDLYNNSPLHAALHLLQNPPMHKDVYSDVQNLVEKLLVLGANCNALNMNKQSPRSIIHALKGSVQKEKLDENLRHFNAILGAILERIQLDPDELKEDISVVAVRHALQQPTRDRVICQIHALFKQNNKKLKADRGEIIIQ